MFIMFHFPIFVVFELLNRLCHLLIHSKNKQAEHIAMIDFLKFMQRDIDDYNFITLSLRL